MHYTKSRSHRGKKLVAALIGAALVSAAGISQAADMEKVSFAYPTNISLSNAPTLMAVGMGYFKEAGLDVSINFFQGSAVMLPQIAQKHVTFGWITPDPLVVSLQPKRDPLPVKMFYNGIYLSPFEIVVPADSPLQSLKDLKGKKIGVGAMSWGNVLVTETMLKDLGYTQQKDYTLVPVGVGPTAFRALQDGSIDALNLFDTFHTQMENRGAKLRRLPFEKKYRELFSSGLIAHNDTLKERPDLVVAFGKAATKGVIACNANPVACVKNFWKLYPNTKPAQGTEQEKLDDAVKVLQVRLKTMIPPEGLKEMGYYTEEAWKHYAELLHAGGQLPTADVPVQTLYTNDFVKSINDFDADAVVAAAKSKE
ncbi:ABC transporter substrate-binding protein [Allopusillimonas soli]|uniref:ABC transporter substrate-binding protein n=1 Tax=Allopusillimonas soli TaxID=659016 RepID=A0A853FGY0_9BURK|nr:ABC transporter substrate-binding protein [Allopusillimonas soli]NYT37701.1 ABC transporter substrate-binding protein [Allopusillimonas soli]TEA74348.1 ABC transporter substrate-binding protein [Allopusillimonas soli]